MSLLNFRPPLDNARLVRRTAVLVALFLILPTGHATPPCEGAGKLAVVVTVPEPDDFRRGYTLYGRKATPEAFMAKWRTHFGRALRQVDYGRGPVIHDYLEAARNSDPRIATLARLGIEFKPESETPFSIPAYPEFAKRYEAWLQEHISAGRLDPAEAIRPGRAFIDPQGNHHFLRIEETPQADWVFVDVSSSPLIFTKMLAQGLFPLSNNWRILHDTGHLAALAENPQFMARLFRLANRSRPGENRPKGADMHVRFFYFFEGLAVVPAAKRALLLPHLSEPLQKNPEGLVTVHDVGRFLTALPKQELNARADKLLQLFPQFVQHYGNWEPGVAGGNSEISDSLPRLARNLKDAKERWIRVEGLPSHLLAYSLARLEVAMWQSTHVTVENFYDDVLARETPKTSPVYRMFVESGVSNGWTARDQALTSPPTPLYQTLKGFLLPDTILSRSADDERADLRAHAGAAPAGS